MGFFETVKKKAKEAFTGESPGVQKYSGSGGRRVGSMSKYGGGSVGGIDASTYREHTPSGKVSHIEGVGAGGYDAVTKSASVGTNRAPKSKGMLDKVVGGAGKGLDWMAKRGQELNAPPKKQRGRAPRGSQPAGYDGSYDMFGVGGFGGGGGGGNWVSQGTMFSGGEAYEEVEAPRKRRKQKSKRARSAPREERYSMTDPGHVPEYLRHMF